ncbi:thiamine-triphosphatase isoform X2 [Rhineura floridana]|nr:thiamine-triphosphatase isoform X2 [Rhineura floridana]
MASGLVSTDGGGGGGAAASSDFCAAAAAGKDLASGSIEVEQKFLFGPDTVEKLVTLGATLEGCVSFCDRYYDTSDWRLTLADHWLRERQGAGWELKCPPQPREGSRVPGSIASSTTENQWPLSQPEPPAGAQSPISEGHKLQHPLQSLEVAGKPHVATQYQEVTCPQDILVCVGGLLGMDPAVGWHGDVARAVEELGLEEFASFVTRRCKYCLASLNLSVDLDEMDFGYAVGEVEAMVKQQEDMPEALERIQELGRQLGLDRKTAIPGKMSVYLHKFRPVHYEALVRAGRLQK